MRRMSNEMAEVVRRVWSELAEMSQSHDFTANIVVQTTTAVCVDEAVTNKVAISNLNERQPNMNSAADANQQASHASKAYLFRNFLLEFECLLNALLANLDTSFETL